MQKNSQKLIAKAWLKLSSEQTQYQDRWVLDETWVRVMTRCYPDLVGATNIDCGKFNRAMTTSYGSIYDHFDSSNDLGIFHKKFTAVCPYSNKRRPVRWYYRTVKGPIPDNPFSPPVDDFAKSHRMQQNRERTTTTEQQMRQCDEVGIALSKNITPKTVQQSQSLANQQSEPPITRDNGIAGINSGESEADCGGDCDMLVDDVSNTHNNSNNSHQLYWESPEAAILFGFEFGADVLEGLRDRIIMLQKVNEFEDGFKLVIPTNGNDHDDDLYSHNIFTIRHKSLFLLKAYQLAIEKMNEWKWVDQCCLEAINELNKLGIKTTTNKGVLAKWNRQFRLHEKFPHPNPYVANGKKPIPPLFDFFPEAKAMVKEYALKKLDCFGVEMMRDELITSIIPGLLEQAHNDNVDPDSLHYNILLNYQAKKPSYSTVWRWVRYLGFNYSTRRISYYVDGHEHPAQVSHRKEHIRKYLRELEPLCHRWIQLTEDEYGLLKEKHDILHKGHSYDGIDGVDMIEFHVDDHECLQELAKNKYGSFGGNVSVRAAPGRPIIIIGQDESIYNQYAFGQKQWVGPAGERAFLPKTDGAGWMVSGMQCREFGFGMELTESQLDATNAKRMGEEYFDKEAAMDVNGTLMKKNLLESPFVRLFEYGANKEGYWTGNHMILQLEDCIDCLKSVYGDTYDVVFLFDHSSGHAKKRADGLDASRMNKGFGGQLQRRTLIKDDSYLGPYTHPQMVRVGHYQTLNYDSADDWERGPFDMDATKREATRHDVEVPLKSTDVGFKDKKKAELVRDIAETETGKVMGKVALQKKKLNGLKLLAKDLNIETKKYLTHRTQPGWMGKGKGLLQVLWERGWIDVNKVGDYRVKAVDDEGNLIPDLSLQHMMAKCTDFENEVTQLEYIGQSLGVRVIITTKYHAEYAGEGVEYSWGFSKSIYRREPLSAKKGKDNFDALVKRCISREVLSVDMIRKFSRRARGYMLTYLALEDDTNPILMTQKQLGNEDEGDVITYGSIENMKKILSSHRAALDFDHGFIHRLVIKSETKKEDENGNEDSL